VLAAPRGPVRRLFDLTGLIGVFSVHANLDQALQTTGSFPFAETAG
jgi:anti-anti-sigma regulatory factor